MKIKSNQSTQADLLLDYLENIGVEYIFGVPGGAIEPLYNALARRQAKGRFPVAVVARHESGAAFMADGYARITGKLGVCCATTGPGTTNLITGIATAFADHIPMLVITPQTALPTFGQKGLQESSCDEIDTIAMLAHCTVYNSFVSHVKQFELKLYQAIISATQPRCGPAHLSIPIDIMSMSATTTIQNTHMVDRIIHSKTVDNHAIDELCAKMLNANKVIIFVGLGARDAIQQIIEFAELILADIVMAPEAKGFIPNNHVLNKGVFGFAGHQSARDTLTDSSISIILAIGTEFDELSTGGWDKEALLNTRLVHIDDHIENFTHSPFANLHVQGNLTVVFDNLVKNAKIAIKSGQRCPILNFDRRTKKRLPRNITSLLSENEIEKYHNQESPVKPQRVMHCLNELMPLDTHFVVDTGNSWAWATHYLNIYQSNHYHISMSFGAMGWAIGAAVGMAMAKRTTAICCITGDGSYLMSGQEITVAKQYCLPIIFIILNDSSLGMIKHGQQLGGAENIANQLPTVDFALMAKSVGVKSYTIKSGEALQHIDIRSICETLEPVLIDVHIDANEVPPMAMRMKVLKMK